MTGRVQGRVGDRSGEGLPGTISNPAVKLASAEGTARVTVWEGTSLPTRLPAAAAPLHAIDPSLTAHCLAAHRSAEPGHALLLQRLGLEPILSLGMRLGEGSGAAVAIPILRAAVATHAGMATFAEAGVSDRDHGE